MKPNGKPAAPAAAKETAPLTELEQLKMENYALKYQSLQQQIQNLTAERSAFIRKIEENHPGHAWDEQRGLVATVPNTPAASAG